MIVIIDRFNGPINEKHPDFDYKELREYRDEDDLIINPVGSLNATLTKHTYVVDECDHSNLELKLFPTQPGSFFIHVLLGNTEVLESPRPITIVKSEKHLGLDKEALEKKLLDQDEAKRAKAAKLQSLKDKEKEKQKMQQLKQEQLAKRRAETENRAKDAVKKAKEAALNESKAREEERRLRKENRCGGGFNLNAVKKKKEE